MRAGLIAFAVLGCATVPRAEAVTDVELALRLPPASLGRELHLAQRVTLSQGGASRSFEAQLEVDGAVLRVAAVALGQTLATFAWDGVALVQEGFTRLGPEVSAQRILSAIVLAWWPAQVLGKALPPRYRLEDAPRARTLFRDGAVWAAITYEGEAPAWRHLRLRRGEGLVDIESVELSP